MPATVGLPSAADDTLQRGEMAKSAVSGHPDNLISLKRTELSQREANFFLALRRQGGLWRKRRADRIALQFEPALDARGEIILRKNLVDAPKFPLQFHRRPPISATTALVQIDALLWYDARWPSHPALSAD